jgi:hypothetical protein
MPRPYRRNYVLPCLSVLGLLTLSFVLGAALMFYELPGSAYLHKAFVGAKAWYDRNQTVADGLAVTSNQELLAPSSVKVDKQDKTHDGFTLIMAAERCKALLINMRGEMVHEWSAPFGKVWPQPTHVPAPVEDAFVCFFSGHLYPNGDLLVVYQGTGHAVYGYGLAKLDKDSKVVWTYSANVHHDVDVADDGTIYAITQDILYEMPSGLESIPTPCSVDSLVLLSPRGEELKKVPLLEVFRDSPYAPLLSTLLRPVAPGFTGEAGQLDRRRRDVLHTNHVRVLRPKLAEKFPLFSAGQVLLSFRHLDAIAVLDPVKAVFVWAARGPWKAQHDVQFLDNGHLLLFDNLGSPGESRVLEYNPKTQAFPWSYSGETAAPFFSKERGGCQRLPNGNTLIVDSDGRELREVTQRKEVVWSCFFNVYLAMGRRYGPEQVQFLKGGQSARP